MSKTLKDIERGERERSPIYLRFSNHVIGRTESYARGEVNVDVDHYDQVVGIEMLSAGPNALRALSEVVQQYDLDVNPLFMAGRR